MDIRPPVLGA